MLALIDILLFCILAFFIASWIRFGYWARSRKNWSPIISWGGGFIVACLSLIPIISTTIFIFGENPQSQFPNPITQTTPRKKLENPFNDGAAPQDNDFKAEVCAAYDSMQDRLNCCKELDIPSDKCTRNARSVKSSAPSFDDQWYIGGTLHRATIEEWMTASYRDRLATSADFVVSITKKENPRLLDGTVSDFLLKSHYLAVELEKCISGVGSEPKASRGFSAAELAAMCYISMSKSRQ